MCYFSNVNNSIKYTPELNVKRFFIQKQIFETLSARTLNKNAYYI